MVTKLNHEDPAHYAALIVQQSPMPSKPSSCLRVLQGTCASISSASSRNRLPLLAMRSPAPLMVVLQKLVKEDNERGGPLLV